MCLYIWTKNRYSVHDELGKYDLRLILIWNVCVWSAYKQHGE